MHTFLLLTKEWMVWNWVKLLLSSSSYTYMPSLALLLLNYYFAECNKNMHVIWQQGWLTLIYGQWLQQWWQLQLSRNTFFCCTYNSSFHQQHPSGHLKWDQNYCSWLTFFKSDTETKRNLTPFITNCHCRIVTSDCDEFYNARKDYTTRIQIWNWDCTRWPCILC